jgi:RNA 2',3'-cyclic 3'-phosphodiesterase
MRLFISIDFSEKFRLGLSGRIPSLDGWKKTPAGNIHLTLFFIGDCTEKEKGALSERLSEISFPPFLLKTGHLGVFPNQKNPRILWCGIQDSDPLLRLQKQVGEQAERFRKTPDKKPFRPHLTLARRKSGFGSDATINHLLNKKYSEMEASVNRFLLKQSYLKPEGSVHIILEEYRADSNQILT